MKWVGWTGVHKGDFVRWHTHEKSVEGRVVQTDVRQSVNVLTLDNGHTIWLWRKGVGSRIEMLERGE